MDQHLSFISALKQRFRESLPGSIAQLQMAPSFRPNVPKMPDTIRAGVLILIYPRNQSLHTVFMKRQVYEGVHSGQISFPGGKEEPYDQTLVETALREAEEEIGIRQHAVEVLGNLSPLYIPVSETEVYPVVGYLTKPPVFKTNPEEVAYLIEPQISDLLLPELRKVKPWDGPVFSGTVPYFDISGEHIWGATAMILAEFVELVNDMK